MTLFELLNESVLSVTDHLKNYSKYFTKFYNATDGIIENSLFRVLITDKLEIDFEYSGKIDNKQDCKKLEENLKSEFKNNNLKKCKCFVGSNNHLVCAVTLKCDNEIRKNKLFRKIEDANLKLKLYYVDVDEKFIILNNNIQAINLIKFLNDY